METQLFKKSHPFSAGPPKRDLTRTLLLISVDSIVPNPNQPRRDFAPESLHELMSSIAQVGLIQPLTVRDVGSYYELISGERRLRACRLLGMREVPRVVADAGAEKSAVMAIIENVQRKDLHFLEEAMGYQKMMTQFGLTQEELADKLGKSQSAISNKLRLLKLPVTIRHMLCNSPLTERHARALLSLKAENEQVAVLSLAIKHEWTVAELERHVSERLEKSAPKPLRIFRLTKDCRLFVNGIKAGVQQLRSCGMHVEMTETKLDNGVDVYIEVRNSQISLFENESLTK